MFQFLFWGDHHPLHRVWPATPGWIGDLLVPDFCPKNVCYETEAINSAFKIGCTQVTVQLYQFVGFHMFHVAQQKPNHVAGSRWKFLHLWRAIPRLRSTCNVRFLEWWKLESQTMLAMHLYQHIPFITIHVLQPYSHLCWFKVIQV